ncbi:hypothetical protein FX988_02940 [Paraglaciecola mesophila]|uniref:Phosphate ABC transporter substrate-binding protein n=1 Tax=Paraglaciecola mesophila TaxID=197222 RepID=A0A857JMU9_9ALTE|nr:hypothetical protein [Paraglaciecola mesophila]QHJ12682.1 hypothetical protein FX988_02940 [Paraglaciecola mesophila]
MKVYTTLMLLFLFSFTPSIAAAESIIVVANTADKSIELNRQQVRNLFMGGIMPYDLKAIALPPENHTRVLFNTKIVGLTESRIQSYWAQMRFTGRKKAPKEVEDEMSVLAYLLSHEGAVGYLLAGTPIPDGLSVIFTVQ